MDQRMADDMEFQIYKNVNRCFWLRSLLFFTILSGVWILSFSRSVCADSLPVLSDSRFRSELIDMTGAYDRAVTEQEAERNPYINGRLIVLTKDGTLDPETYGAESAIRNREGCYILQFANSVDARKAAIALARDASVLSVEPDVPLFAQQISFSAQASQVPGNWGTSYTGCDAYANYISQKGNSTVVRVAVIDSGIRKTHELFNGRISSIGEYDFINNDKDATDDNGHGTMVAGVVAECTPGLNQIKLIPVKALDSNGETEVSTIMIALRTLAGKSSGGGQYYRNAEVINLSFVSVTAIRNSTVLKKEIADATSAGAVVVLAAGNQNEDTAVHPPANITDADAPGSVIVASCDSSGKPSNFSNYGASVDLCAPGSNVVTAYYSSNNAYAVCNGSSFSAPCVCAAAAMLKAVEASLSPFDVEKRLETYVKPINDSSGRKYGTGILDMTKGIAASQPAPKDPEPDPQPDPGTVQYPGSNPRANVLYQVPLKKNTKTSALRVEGLAGGDTVDQWKSSASDKVQVTGKADGTCQVIAGSKTGKAVITAKTASGKEVRFRVKVLKGIVKTKKIIVESKTLTMPAGSKKALAIKLYPVTSTEKIKYSSSSKKIVNVTKKGVLTAKAKGTAVITVTSGSKKVRIKVRVTG